MPRLGEAQSLGVQHEVPKPPQEEVPLAEATAEGPEAANDANIEQPKSYESIGRARIDAVKGFFKSRISGAFETMKAFGGALKGGAEKTLNTAFAAPEMVRDAGTFVGDQATLAKEKVKTGIESTVTRASDEWSAGKKAVIEGVSDAASNIREKAVGTGRTVKQGIETHVTRAVDMSHAFSESVVEKGFQVGESVKAGASEIYQSGREKVQNLQERGKAVYMNAKLRVDSAKNTFSEKKNSFKARALEKIMQVKSRWENMQRINAEIKRKEQEIAQLKAARTGFMGMLATAAA